MSNAKRTQKHSHARKPVKGKPAIKTSQGPHTVVEGSDNSGTYVDPLVVKESEMERLDEIERIMDPESSFDDPEDCLGIGEEP